MLIVTVSPVCAVAPVEKTENPSAASAPKEKKHEKSIESEIIIPINFFSASHRVLRKNHINKFANIRIIHKPYYPTLHYVNIQI